MTKLVQACPDCNNAVDRNRNHREWKHGGIRVNPGEEWKCHDCGYVFGDPVVRASKRGFTA